MFEILDGLPAIRTRSATHEANRILKHLAHLPARERDEAARELGVFLREQETDLAIALVQEIEKHEGRPLSTLTYDEIWEYIGMLTSISRQRDHEEDPITPERRARAEAALEEMRKIPIYSHWAA